MNKFKTTLTDVVIFTKMLGHMAPAALEVNKISNETKQDFINSKRSGQAAIAVSLDLRRVCGHYVPDSETEQKVRFSIAANNKINLLIENPDRSHTFPLNEEEKIKFPEMRIFGGGIRFTGLPLIAISGYHPRIDEACGIVFGNQYKGFHSDNENINQIQTLSKFFSNPYALAIASGSGFIKKITFSQAIEWGKNEFNFE